MKNILLAGIAASVAVFAHAAQNPTVIDPFVPESAHADKAKKNAHTAGVAQFRKQLKKSDFEAAAESLRQIKEIGRASPGEIGLLNATLAFAMNDAAKAVAILKEVAEKNPDNAEIQFSVASMIADQERLKVGVEGGRVGYAAARRLPKEATDDVKLLLAKLAYYSGDNPAAVATLNALREKEEESGIKRQKIDALLEIIDGGGVWPAH